MVSRPIKATPILKGRHARRFKKLIKDGLRHPVGPVPTPKIDMAIELIKKEIEAKNGPIYKLR